MHSLDFIQVHEFIPTSQVNGPGARAVLWLQGCTLGCPGCFNPETHSPLGGRSVSIDGMFEKIAALQSQVEGLTVSGGEPLQQRRPLQKLVERIRRETGLSVLVFTGFSWEELRRMPEIDTFFACVDVLLAGRYDRSQRVAAGLIGSTNKTVHFLTSRYSPADLEKIPEAEIILQKNGDVLFSGIDPLKW